MTAIIKNKFRLKNAKNFIENFEIPKNSDDVLSLIAATENPLTQSQKNILQETLKRTPDRNHYLFIGKPFGWDVAEDPTNTNSNTELNPPPPLDTQNGDHLNKRKDGDASVWDEMLGLKKINRHDVSLVIPRSDYRANTVYAQFDDADPDLYRQPTPTRIQEETSKGRRAGNFYALNNMMELFICVDNNNNSVSTVQPSRLEMNGANSNINGRLRTSDGYVWQFITTLSAGDAVKFLTDSWIPVRTLPPDSNLDIPQEDVQSNAIAGELLRVEVKSPTNNLDVFHHYVGGKVEKSSTEANKLVIVLATGLPLPRLGAGDVDAYKGYQILVRQPNDDTGAIFAKYTITSYSLSPAPTLTLSTNATTLLANTQYPCEILPLINVETNGEPTIDVRPVLNAAGKITSVKIINPGSRASTVKLSVNQPHNFAEANLPTLRSILSPTLGLGKDPESDLGAFFVMMSTQLKYNEGEGDFPIANDYRQIGIIRDVKKLTKNSSNQDVVVLAKDDTLNATTVVTVKFDNEEKLGANKLAFQSDDVVDIKLENTSTVVGKAKVVQFVRNPDTADNQGQRVISGKLFLLQTKETGYYPIATGQTYSVRDVEADAYSPDSETPAVVKEEFLKFHGDIVYLENRRAVLRSIDQIEDIKTIVEF